MPFPAMSGANRVPLRRLAFSPMFAPHQAQAANQSGAEIGNDVAVEILAEQNVELFGAHDKLHRCVVDDLVFSFDLRMIFTDFVKTSQEQSVGQLHDVRFVHAGDLLAVFAQRIVEREVRMRVEAFSVIIFRLRPRRE